MGTVARVFSFLIIFSLSSLPNSHSHFLPVRSLFLSQKTQTHILSSSILSPSLTSLFLSFIACHQRGEIDAWHVAWSWWWRCGFELMIDGSDVGRPRWWFNLSLWCGSVLICVGLLGLGWFGLWVDLGMVWSGWSRLIWVCGSGLIRLMADGCWWWWWLWVWVDRVDLGRWVWVDRVDLGMCGGVEVWRHGDDGVLIGIDFSLCGLIDVGWSDVESNFSCGLISMWVDRYVWVDLIFLWFLMMVVMVARWWWWLWVCVREGQWESE